MEHMPPIAPGAHLLPPLPYPAAALSPLLDAPIIQLHHDKHHKKYVDDLNQAELALSQARKERDFQFIPYWENRLAFNGSGHILHSIYWTNMTAPGQGGQPGHYTAGHLNWYFGGEKPFREQFSAAAKAVEGSGWCVLGYQPAFSRLELFQCQNHQNILQWGVVPILVCDVWEHAYYLQYKNDRGGYVDNWWQLVNWPDVERRLIAAVGGRLPLTL